VCSCLIVGKLPEDALKVKKSELRLYCDLLMQQVHGVKCAVENKESPNVEVSVISILAISDVLLL